MVAWLAAGIAAVFAAVVGIFRWRSGRGAKRALIDTVGEALKRDRERAEFHVKHAREKTEAETKEALKGAHKEAANAAKPEPDASPSGTINALDAE